jgi:rod shape-determining protein MreC
MNYNDAFTLRGLRIMLINFVGWVNSVETKITRIKDLQKENKNLREQNLNLAMANQQLQEIMIENIRLRRLLQFSKDSKYEFKAAEVIGLGQEGTVSSILLDVGYADSIKKNMAVITDMGLVGKILRTEEYFSVAQILFDRNSLVSARLQNSRELGTIIWGGNVWLDLGYVPNDVVVELGETVITSGLSEIYPPGIKIGVVGEIEQDDYSLFKKIKVKPAVNFNSLEEVFIVFSQDSLLMENDSIE